MRIKTLIALLLILLVITSMAHAQDATVEAPTEEAGIAVQLIEPVAIELATEEATPDVELIAPEEAATEEATDAVVGEGENAEAESAAEASTESDTPAGSALLMLLLGVGVVAAVGGLTMMRGGNKS